ncbi:MAG: sortase [Chloroflexi bacterium]|nr:sortase [Chloroflexota bacterium]
MTPTYSNNTNVGTATANATYAGDANHAGNSNSATFDISQATSTVTVTCPASVIYTGAAQTPCTASYSTSDGLNGSLTPTYSNNTNVGTATANATYAGDANHAGNSNSGTFDISQATSSVTVTCPVAAQPYTGSAQTPCTAEATGAGMSPVDVSASLVYSNNINVGIATADASWGGDASHTGSNGSGSFAIGLAAQTITVITSAPATASNGSTFDVAATATSGLPVTITTSGVCTGGDTDGTATITMTSGTGTCSVFYDQAGDGNYLQAPKVQEDVTATEGPSFTSADNTSIDMGFFGTFTVTAVGNPSTMAITLTGGTLPAGVTLTDNGDGTATLQGTPTAGTSGIYNLVFTADNGVLPNGTQNFTLTIRNGPIIGADGINSIPETSGGSVIENESILDTLGITHLLVEFSQDVYNPAGDTDPKDVTNPANYQLVRTPDGVFSTVSCEGGVISPDVSISVDSVTYSNGGGSGPYIATLAVNGGFPLNVVGFHRLYVCGTTSIVDANNTNLVLAGNGTTPATDFQRNFSIVIQGGGGGGGGGGGAGSGSQIGGNFLIPVTGFAPHQTTPLPAQPADKFYKPMGEMTLEIPSLAIKYPIVGAPITNKTWDLTWLQNSVAYLEGSAYPTLAGNTVLTAHVLDANHNPGPFSDIKGMQVGQKIYIHVNGQTYVYQVQESRKILPTSISKVFKHEEDSWITLVTCEDFNAKTGLYAARRMVRAVLISVIPAKK